MTVQSHKIINIIHGYYFIFYRFVARSKIFFHVLKIPLYIFLSIVSLKIHHDQKNILKKKYDNEKVKSLILFVTPGIDIVNGGVMSIASIYNETKLMREIHNSFTIASSLPGDFSILNYTKFKNNMSIYNFSLIMNYFNELESILIHIPESFVNNFIKLLTPYQRKKLINIKKIHFNILLQNIILLPTKKDIKKLNAIGEVTITTAHQKYSTIKWRRLIGFPIHKLSTFCSPEFYYFKQYIEKQNIIIISPDFHIKKNQVIDLLNKIKKFSRIVVIQNLKFEEYKQLISLAKWALTFGEGLDGYFIEPIFSGAISFSVYNPHFFTEDFQNLKTVYNSYDDLICGIQNDIEFLDNEAHFKEYQDQLFTICKKYYSYNTYRENIRKFYTKNYTFP